MNSCFELSEQVRKLEARVTSLTSNLMAVGIYVPPSKSDLIRDSISTARTLLQGTISVTPEEDSEAIFQEILIVLDNSGGKEVSQTQHGANVIPPYQSPLENRQNYTKSILQLEEPTNLLSLSDRDRKLDREGIFEEIFQFHDEDTIEFEKSPIQPEGLRGRSIIPC